ncbi:MAG: hypothetical protein A2045_09645 [Rhodocyclales bacterium GWA2_65_20]|nr:MAG: hypothetical protein A2045_09645 [Rhodocyclales bacterium GWA2_65_20]
MSYVLDALRKSAQEGRTAAAPGAAMLAPVGAGRGRRIDLRQPLVAGAALAAAAAGALGWMWSPPAVIDVAGQSVVAGPAPPAAAQAEDIAALRLSPSIALTVPPPAKPPSAPAAKENGAAAQAAARPAPPTATAVATATDKAISGAQARPATGAGLPAALRQQLPPLAVSGFILDEQAGSLAIIDDKVLRVGDEAAPGLRIEKIDGNGVAFSYRGYRFRR